jgi:site-specific recombinase XerD
VLELGAPPGPCGGHPPKIVSELLGHGQVGITLDLYSHVTATMQEAVRAFQAC